LPRALPDGGRIPRREPGLRELFRQERRQVVLGMSLSYESSGVKYGPLDAFKRACQKAALTTTDLLAGHGFREPSTVRGESAYLIEAEDHFLAHVEEGLGTKNL